MIKSILIVLPLATGFWASAQTDKDKCEQNVYPIGVDIYPARGKNPNIKRNFEKGKIVILPGKADEAKTRGQKVCMVTLVNALNRKVHVYIDSLYEGTLQVDGFGFIKRKTNYSTVYCVTEDGRRSWNVQGDCSCQYTFHLK